MSDAMRNFCREQFRVYDEVEGIKASKKQYREAKTKLHEQMIAYMQENGLQNMQMAPDGNVDNCDETLQVHLTKYWKSESVLKEDLMTRVRDSIDWAQLLRADVAPVDRVDLIFDKIQSTRKTSAPLIKVQKCGKLNRSRLPFVDPKSSLQKMVHDYGRYKEKLASVDRQVKTMMKTPTMQECERMALEDLTKSRLTRKVFEIKGTKYAVKKHEINRTKPPTVKQVKECVQNLVLSGNLERATFCGRLLALLRAANEPQKVVSVTFEKVVVKAKTAKRKRGGGSSSSSSGGGGGSGSVSGGSRSTAPRPAASHSGGLLVSRRTLEAHTTGARTSGGSSGRSATTGRSRERSTRR